MISSFCSGGECVEVERLRDGGVIVRNTQILSEDVTFTAEEWAAFVAGVKNGEFDLERLR